MDSCFKLKNDNPKIKAGLISRLFFAWMIKLFKRDNLKLSDLYRVLPCDESERLGDALEANWHNEIQRAKLKQRPPRLLRALFNTFFWKYMIYGVLLFFQHVGLRSFQPVVLSFLISLFSKSEDTRVAMYISASILVAISIVVIFIMHHVNYGQYSVGMKVRVAVSSLIYRKTLKLNKKSLNQTAIGHIINLLSNDVNRFDLVFMALHYLWIMPFQVVVITWLIWQQVGVSTLAGVLSMVLLTLPLQSYLGKLTSSFRSKVAERTDYRITLMSEIISGIQVIKMYAWEKPFERVVRLARLKEVKHLTSTSYLRGIYLSFMVFVERVTLFLTVTCYVLLGNVIFAEQVFAMAQFFSMLQLTMSIFYPMSITYGAETLVAIDRIEHFLTMDENEESVIEIDEDGGVCMKNINASWTSDKVTLRNINLDIPRGSLCAIIGPVGAGKTSILQLLLGELRPSSGTIRVQGKISYCSQESWLFSSTIRSNILFGEKYSRQLYNHVIKACALQKDFQQFPKVDKTSTGERGASLSGGQKARVNLARAVYRDADIYLLDDPLSAVDTHVGKHLFEECIMKYLKGKTRILVTHQLQYLKKADLIILLNEGSIETHGTYEDLINSKLNFTKMMISAEDSVAKEQDVDAMEEKQSLLLSYSSILESIDIRNGSSSRNNEDDADIVVKSPLKEYIRASGNYCVISLLGAFLILGQMACSGADYWVTFWTQQEALRHSNKAHQVNISTEIPPAHNIEFQTLNNEYINRDANNYYYNRSYTEYASKNDNVNAQLNLIDPKMAIYIYSSLIASAIVITMTRSCLYFKLAMNASKNLHNKMFSALLQTPMSFFNTNPSGRILNRFAKDMGAIDEILPRVLMESIQITLVLCGILLMVLVSNYFMIVTVIILGFFFLKIRSWFIRTAKRIKHLEGLAKSPMFSHIHSTLDGITTIRAFHAEEILEKEFDTHQNVHTAAWFLTIMCTVAFGLWIDIICVIFIASTTFSFIILNQYGQVSGSLVGLAISQSLVLTGMLQYGIRQTAEVINQLTSVQRVLQYTHLEKEGPFKTPPEIVIPKPWPSFGVIVFESLFLRYSPDGPPILKGLNLIVRPGEKIGIVGRTGAGKSSLISALFRLAINEGYIFIDGVDLKYVGLEDLRKNLSIIPQEPVLFSASLRYNLDPFDEFEDYQIWNVLQEVKLKDAVESLDITVSGGGNNFSVGQRQLLCLARAILRNNKILILDEATANIDPRTDALIQETIRDKFQDCTVLTIAHRLNTIMDSDRVIVMENGRIVEYDYPYKLLQKPHTNFYKMVLETGPSMSEHLEDVALDAFLHKKSSEYYK